MRHSGVFITFGVIAHSGLCANLFKCKSTSSLQLHCRRFVFTNISAITDNPNEREGEMDFFSLINYANPKMQHINVSCLGC